MHSLVPVLSVSLLLAVFSLAKNLMIKLITLLMLSVLIPVMFINSYKVFWPCGLLLILITTGLMVVFAYIVSLHTSQPESHLNKYSALSLTLTLASFSFLLSNSFYMKVKPVQSAMYSVTSDLEASLVLIALLVFLVVFFMRLVYSKGGGFRKKF